MLAKKAIRKPKEKLLENDKLFGCFNIVRKGHETFSTHPNSDKINIIII